MLPPSERTVRGQRGGIIELPYIADPRLQRARPPTDLEIAAAHVTSPSFLGMPPHIFKRIAEYVLLYEQPEELVQKPIHRRMVEVTKAHVLTVSSEKVVRSGNKQVARNLNTASLTNFFLVCRHFRDVGVKLYYGLNTFRFSSDDNMHGWAKAIGSRRKFVRSIQLDSHWEVQFRNGEISPEALRIVCDHGIISSTAFGMFRNLQKVHLSIGCALECHHDAFQQQHGQLDSHIEGFCWGVASQQAGYMCQALRDDELRSRTVDLSHYLIFDGAFVVGKSNRVDYHARMKDFVWKMRAADAGLPKSRQLSYRGRGSLLPGPRLPNTPAIVAPAPTGAWSQPFVNDESIFSDSSRFGLVYVHDHSAADWSATVADWSAIADDLRAPDASLQYKRCVHGGPCGERQSRQRFTPLWSSGLRGRGDPLGQRSCQKSSPPSFPPSSSKGFQQELSGLPLRTRSLPWSAVSWHKRDTQGKPCGPPSTRILEPRLSRGLQSTLRSQKRLQLKPLDAKLWLEVREQPLGRA